MATTLFIAKMFGVVYLAVGLGMLISADHYTKIMDDFMSKPALVYFGGLLALLAGITLTSVHNVWEGGLETVITILGWLAFLKGVTLLIAPENIKIWKGFLTKKNIKPFGTIVTVVGALFTYFGYFG